jgi:hypothetical protein
MLLLIHSVAFHVTLVNGVIAMLTGKEVCQHRGA